MQLHPPQDGLGSEEGIGHLVSSWGGIIRSSLEGRSVTSPLPHAASCQSYLSSFHPMSTFEKLKRFISQEMRMSAVYQPVMLIELIKNKGRASVTQIAQSILNRDPSQIEYYSLIALVSG